MEEQIDTYVIDAFKEISNIAAGHLSEVISQVTKKEMSLSVPRADIADVKETEEIMGGKGASILVGYMNVFGDVMGSVVILLKKHDAIKLTSLTLAEEANPMMFPSALEKDALRELITITGGALLNAITQFLEIYFVPTAPIISLFGAFNLLNFLKTRSGSLEEYEKRKTVLVSIEYKIEDTDTKGVIYMLIGPTILDYVSNELDTRQKK